MTRAAAATPHERSTEAARSVLAHGGNAVDAAIAAVSTQGVVAPETCGLGGDLFALVHQPGWDRPRALNASGRAGSKADASELQGLDEVPPDHPLTVTIPGCVDGLATLSAELGSIPFASALEPAITAAKEGFVVSKEQALAFERTQARYLQNPAVAEFYPDGTPVRPGMDVRRPALARTLADLAEGGREAFYQGRPGEDIVAAVGGIITPEDLAAPQDEWVDPIGVEVAGLTAWTTPPNSQGYLGPASLAVFEMLDPPDNPSDPLWWHLLIEAYRCLAWERNDIVADPECLPLPVDLYMDRARLERAASTISRDRAGVWPTGMGKPSGTAYMCVADGDGMGVSIIQSNYRGTGSPFGAAHSGFLLQDRGGGFSLTPGHPNELAPGKRPLHTLSPTLWTEQTEARWLIGTRGGAVQPQLIAQVAARAVLGTDEAEEALAAPRWTIAEFGPGSAPRLTVEPGVSEEILEGLQLRGHLIDRLSESQPGWGPVSVIWHGPAGTVAASDPRVETTSAVVF